MMTRILNFVDEQVPEKVKLSFFSFLAGLTVFDVLDWAWRIVTGVMTIILFVYAHIRHKRKMKNLRLDEQIRQQQLYDIIQSNKKKYG